MTDMTASSMVGEIKKASRMLKAFRMAEEIAEFIASKESLIKTLVSKTKDAEKDAEVASNKLEAILKAVQNSKDETTKITSNNKEKIEAADSSAAKLLANAREKAIEIKAEAQRDRSKIKAEIASLSTKKQDLSVECSALEIDRDNIVNYIANQKKKLEGILS